MTEEAKKVVRTCRCGRSYEVDAQFAAVTVNLCHECATRKGKGNLAKQKRKKARHTGFDRDGSGYRTTEAKTETR